MSFIQGYHELHGPLQAATNITRWKASNECYSVKWQQFYEPFYIAHHKSHAPYDSRFLGVCRLLGALLLCDLLAVRIRPCKQSV
jgi:hypothetical protein